MLSEIYEGWRNNLLPPEKLKKVITQTSKQRLEICEKCGKKGRLRTQGWMKTRCNECQREYEKGL